MTQDKATKQGKEAVEATNGEMIVSTRDATAVHPPTAVGTLSDALQDEIAALQDMPQEEYDILEKKLIRRVSCRVDRAYVPPLPY